MSRLNKKIRNSADSLEELERKLAKKKELEEKEREEGTEEENKEESTLGEKEESQEKGQVKEKRNRPEDGEKRERAIVRRTEESLKEKERDKQEQEQVGQEEEEEKELREEIERLREKKAELANQEVQVRLLLELLALMEKKGEERTRREAETRQEAGKAAFKGTRYSSQKEEAYEKEEKEEGKACYGVEDFYARTRYVPPVEVGEGRIGGFSDEMIIRYLSQVKVLEDGYEVIFKAGVTVRM